MKYIASSIVAIATICLPLHTMALPRFALVVGARCGSCHVNPTGGQIRNEFGSTWDAENLTLPESREDDFPINTRINDNLSFGFDYRSQFIYDRLSKTTTFQAMTTSLYGAVRLSSKVVFYFKQDIINGTYGSGFGGTEVYGLVRLFPRGWYIKGGSFLPDYGWKIDDHTAYTRGGDVGILPGSQQPSIANGLIFGPNYKDIGAEVGGTIENLTLTAGLFNGSGNIQPIDPSQDKAYVAKVDYMGSLPFFNWRLGASGYGFKSFRMGGMFVGFASSDSIIVILGEIDWTHNYLLGSSVAENINTMAAFAEVDYRAIHGLWLVGRFDVFDPLQGVSDDDASPATNTLKRIILGLEFFPYSFVEVRPQYRLLIEQPTISNDQALVQMHLWF